MSFTDQQDVLEPEVIASRLAFPDAQAWLDGHGTAVGEFNVGWFGSTMISTRGCFAVVNLGQDNVANLVGEILRIRNGPRSVLVYCVARTTLPWDIAISRRAFLELSLLTEASLLSSSVETIA